MITLISDNNLEEIFCPIKIELIYNFYIYILKYD